MRYIETIFEEILGNIIFQAVYVIAVFVYLGKLRAFNKMAMGEKNPFDIMFMNGGEAWYLLGFALIFTALAGYLFWYHWNIFSSVGGYSMITLIVFDIILVWLVCLIFRDIDNPILRAAIVVIFGGAVLVSIASSS